MQTLLVPLLIKPSLQGQEVETSSRWVTPSSQLVHSVDVVWQVKLLLLFNKFTYHV